MELSGCRGWYCTETSFLLDAGWPVLVFECMPREGNKHLKATTSHLDISMCASNLISRLAAVVETMVE